MIKASRIGFMLVISAWALLEPGAASAQFGGAGSATSGTGTPLSMMANPYMNPYMNPYLNPLATQQPMTAQNAMLYMYMANQANGGLGSGRLSGTRGGAATAAKSRVAEMPYTAHPGGGAARYFNPGPRAANGAGRYYNQSGRYFQNNGH
jgi:hypothetical protein